MEGCDGEPDGSPGELTFRRYRRFGAGGAKLIWGEAAAVVPEGRANPRQLVISPSTAPALERMLRETRQSHLAATGADDDLLVGLQLTHSGRYSFAKPILAQHDPLLDPRTILDKTTGRTAGADDPLISDDELDRLQDRYVEAAGLAFRIGFDFVDIKQCHRYLLNELLAARTRNGKYGGSDREPDAIHPRGRRADPVRASRPDHRHPPERLRRRALSERPRRPRGTLPFHATAGFGLGHSTR